MFEYSDTEVRLVGSYLPREGRLEVKFGGIWGTVCGDAFDDVDAAVACYTLGYGYVSVEASALLTNAGLNDLIKA